MNRRIFSERGYDIKGKVLPIDKLRLFRNAENGFTISEEMKKNMIRRAERSLSEEFPALIASDYMMFKRDGNRSVYEGKYFPRRGALIAFLSGEYAEGKGRFIDKIIDLAWLILEETSWVVPAHNPPKLGVPQILPFAACF